MVEIAISLAVIAFALVAIIGVLPMGIGVQRENKEDTLVNQDGPYWLDAVRNSTERLDYLTNHVEYITIESWSGGVTNIVRFYDGYTYPRGDSSLIPMEWSTDTNIKFIGRFDLIRNARQIIGLLSTPKYIRLSGAGTYPPVIQTNRVTALVHSLTGAAVEQGTLSPDLSFSYQITAETMPFSFFAAQPATYFDNDGTAENLARSNRFVELSNVSPGYVVQQGGSNVLLGLMGAVLRADNTTVNNSFETRVTLRWPVRPDGTTVARPRRQEFRGITAATLTNHFAFPDVTPVPSVPASGEWRGFWFFQSQFLVKP